MFLVYIDESGKPDYNQDEGIFCLSAVCIHGSLWNTIDQKMRGIKKKHFPHLDPSKIEVHLKDISRGKGPFHGKSNDEKVALLDDCFGLICGSDCTLISVLINKNKRYNNNFDSERWGLQFLFERICWYLDAKNKQRALNGLSPELSLMLIDSDPNHDAVVNEKLLPFYHNGSPYCKNQWIARHPIFMESHKDNLLQLADLVAYSSRRAHSTARRPDGLWDQKNMSYFNQIQPKMLANTNGRIDNYGLKIFPK